MKRIRLTESQFNRLVSKCVKRCLNENTDDVEHFVKMYGFLEYVNDVNKQLPKIVGQVERFMDEYGFGSVAELSKWVNRGERFRDELFSYIFDGTI